MIRLALIPALFALAACGAESFRDCPDCPEMIVLQPGTFTRGATLDDPAADESEYPRHEIHIEKPFALALTAVTVEDFSAFTAATGHRTAAGCYTLTENGWQIDPAASWQAPGFPQQPSHPVVCVSWRDAAAYTEWMRARTGEPYRLPSEAEWEYAARAQTNTANFWGDDDRLACDYANVNDLTAKNKVAKVAEPCTDGFLYTSPVGSFRPNPFGFFDMVGNTWVWLADCWQSDFRGGPRDGSPAVTRSCGTRALRGGSWTDTPGPVRIGARENRAADERLSIVGFRLARDLD